MKIYRSNIKRLLVINSISEHKTPHAGLSVRQLNSEQMIGPKRHLDTDVSNFAVNALYTKASAETGHFVRQLPNGLPFVNAKNGDKVLLYHIVEEMEEVINYDELKARLPMLSYGQIAGTIAFLRKLCQFNSQGLNIDDFDDRTIEDDKAFQLALSNSKTDGGSIRVLNPL